MSDITQSSAHFDWMEVKDSAMSTIGKTGGKEPDYAWKKWMLLAEHSPIRAMNFTWKWENLKYWVSVHITRHWLGIVHWVSTQRTDRTGVNRDNLPQHQFVTHKATANVQALINISRKRLCSQASLETRLAWNQVVMEIQKYDPVIASVLVPECIYRGFCPERNCCGYVNSIAYKERLKKYRSEIEEIE